MVTLSDTKLRSLNPRTGSYQMADGEGLYVEVLPSAAISFRYQYRIAGYKECVVLGTYPTLSLAKARQKHRAFQTMVEHRIALRVLPTHPTFFRAYRTSIDRGYHAQ